MSTEGIISIIITLILGIPSLITLFKINQTKIVHLEKHLINLKDDLLKNFDDLSIKYKGIEVQKNIYFISGFLVCQGKKDISDEKNYVDITIPDNWKWLDYKIVSNSKGMILNNVLNENNVSLKFDLFKTKEFVEYEGIIEINDDIEKHNISKQIEFHHRIPNVPKIERFNIETLKSGLSLLTASILIAFIPLFIAYEYNKIDLFDLKAYNAVTNEELSFETMYSISNFHNLEEKVAKESSGFTLLFNKKTNNFLVEYYESDGTKSQKLNSVYFKMKDWGILNWILSIFLSILFILSVFGVISAITIFYYNKRYLKLIGK
ncbi:hypothetical protein [Flavobacterium sp.]|jgi:hypothetical protein|uniref:hypothetical protein n=1 Tax=Flavobacterium sp. TaxID=239 RepID=UPI0037C0E2CD